MSAPRRAAFKGRTYRLIASRYPTVGLFDDIAGDEEDLRAAFELEALTNDRTTATERLRRILGGAVAMGQYGASMVMAAFLHADPAGGRFTDHRLGAWYAAGDIATAIEETVYHQARQIGRASGRERMGQYGYVSVVAVSLKNKTIENTNKT